MNEQPDPEIEACRVIAASIEALDADARYRVLSWAWARFVYDQHRKRLRELKAPPVPLELMPKCIVPNIQNPNE